MLPTDRTFLLLFVFFSSLLSGEWPNRNAAIFKKQQGWFSESGKLSQGNLSGLGCPRLSVHQGHTGLDDTAKAVIPVTFRKCTI